MLHNWLPMVYVFNGRLTILQLFSAVLILLYYGLSNVSHGLPMALKLFWYGVGVINKRREKQTTGSPARRGPESKTQI